MTKAEIKILAKAHAKEVLGEEQYNENSDAAQSLAEDFEAGALAVLESLKKPVLTEREQKAIDNINAVLNDDGSDPDYNPSGAWDDCGEVDVPILLELVARLTK